MSGESFFQYIYLCHRISIPRIARTHTDFLPSEFCGLFISTRFSRTMQVFVFREYKSVSICAICGRKTIPFVGKLNINSQMNYTYERKHFPWHDQQAARAGASWRRRRPHPNRWEVGCIHPVVSTDGQQDFQERKPTLCRASSREARAEATSDNSRVCRSWTSTMLFLLPLILPLSRLP